MKPEKIGFIGAGNIAESIIRGIITSGYLDPGQIIISDINQKRLIQLHQMLGPTIAWSNKDNAAQASSLRCFFRYAEMCSWCQRGLAEGIKAARVFPHERLPAGPS